MAVIALAIIESAITNAGNNTVVDVAVSVSILGNDIGDLDNPSFGSVYSGLNPTALLGVSSQVAAAVKSDLQSHGITFGILDTITVI